MKRSILLFSALVAGVVAVGAQAANAALVNDLVTFTASGFTSAFGQPVPTDPVTGSFTITFDPTQTYTDETSGITLKSLNISLGSALAFDYSPTGNTNGDADELVVGGLQTGAGSVSLAPTVFDDFYLHIFTYSSTPTFQQVGYTTSSATPNSNYFFTNLPDSGAGSVTVTPITSGVPEPSTWAMMLAGFAGLGFLGYRQTVKARLAA
jgi:PEP-CTERM motif